jgi:hypothetical protein
MSEACALWDRLIHNHFGRQAPTGQTSAGEAPSERNLDPCQHGAGSYPQNPGRSAAKPDLTDSDLLIVTGIQPLGTIIGGKDGCTNGIGVDGAA